MLDNLRYAIGELHKTNRASLETDCAALKSRIETARCQSLITEAQAIQLTYDVHNERARCSRYGLHRRAASLL
ncbi:hypothetical protein SAMN05444064_1412 [Pseudomonas syringae]|nr:hypothetical protein SAMN05444514_1422 [Pseudomonas syringae]SFM82910.1 hypothetical protein SAMN05444064_1412 [Pseudomonas syringae]